MQLQYKKVFITGCGGMLGNAIYPYFKARAPEVLAIDIEIEEHEKDWLTYLDVREPEQLKKTFQEFQPDLVLHLAALVDVEKCELDPADAENTNATATKTIADLCEQNNVTMVYICTGGIFDGKKDDYYTEEDEPNPLMVYGATKYQGELYVCENVSRYYVIRPGWMVGGGLHIDHKFVKLILEQIAEGKSVIHAVNDKVGTPTYTHDFAMNLFDLLNTDKFGVYHMVCKGSGSRYDVAKEIVNICNRDDIEVQPVSSDFFQEQFPVPRPDNEMLLNQNLERLGINHMRPWREAIREYITREYAKIIAP
jgi:dTDP-4-dehydrorhamnose reductase